MGYGACVASAADVRVCSCVRLLSVDEMPRANGFVYHWYSDDGMITSFSRSGTGASLVPVRSSGSSYGAREEEEVLVPYADEISSSALVLLESCVSGFESGGVLPARENEAEEEEEDESKPAVCALCGGELLGAVFCTGCTVRLSGFENFDLPYDSCCTNEGSESAAM